MNQNIIYFDRPTLNGRIYTAECFSLLSEILLVTMGDDENTSVSLNHVVGSVDQILITQDRATIIWHTLSTPMGQKFFNQSISQTYGFSPVGAGIIGDDGRVTDYKLSHFSIIKDNIYD